MFQKHLQARQTGDCLDGYFAATHGGVFHKRMTKGSFIQDAFLRHLLGFMIFIYKILLIRLSNSKDSKMGSFGDYLFRGRSIKAAAFSSLKVCVHIHQ